MSTFREHVGAKMQGIVKSSPDLAANVPNPSQPPLPPFEERYGKYLSAAQFHIERLRIPELLDEVKEAWGYGITSQRDPVVTRVRKGVVFLVGFGLGALYEGPVEYTKPYTIKHVAHEVGNILGGYEGSYQGWQGGGETKGIENGFMQGTKSSSMSINISLPEIASVPILQQDRMESGKKLEVQYRAEELRGLMEDHSRPVVIIRAEDRQYPKVWENYEVYGSSVQVSSITMTRFKGDYKPKTFGRPLKLVLPITVTAEDLRDILAEDTAQRILNKNLPSDQRTHEPKTY